MSVGDEVGEDTIWDDVDVEGGDTDFIDGGDDTFGFGPSNITGCFLRLLRFAEDGELLGDEFVEWNGLFIDVGRSASTDAPFPSAKLVDFAFGFNGDGSAAIS